LIDRAALSMDL